MSLAALTLLTMGSGFFAPAIVFALVSFRAYRRTTTWRLAWPTLLVTGILIAVGIFTRVPTPWHEAQKAQRERESGQTNLFGLMTGPAATHHNAAAPAAVSSNRCNPRGMRVFSMVTPSIFAS